MTHMDRSNTVLRIPIVAFLRKRSSFLTRIIGMLETKKTFSTMNLLGFIFEIPDHSFFFFFGFTFSFVLAYKTLKQKGVKKCFQISFFYF